MQKTAILYARVSTDDQQDNYSLSSQLQACRDYAAKQQYVIVAEYSEVFTGSTLNRPQLNEVAKRAGAFDVLIVHSSNRLSRDTVDLLVFNQRLLSTGTSIEYLMNPVDGSTSIGEVMLALQGYAAKEHRLAILEAMKRGRQERVQAGKVLVGDMAPYGYTYNQEAGTLVVNEEQAAVVRQIFQWYVYGDESGKKLGSTAIARRLHELGIPSASALMPRKKGNARIWTYGVVAGILRNETYTGTWTYGKRTYSKQANRTEPVHAAVPAIIDPAVFALARKQSAENRKEANRNTHRHYLLRGRCVCAKCGYGLCGRTAVKKNKSTHGYYSCLGTDRQYAATHGFEPCSGLVRQELLENAVWAVVRDFLKNPEKVVRGSRKMAAKIQREAETLQTYITACEEHLEALDQEQRKLLDLYLAGRVTDSMYEEKRMERELRIADYQAKLEDYRQQLEHLYVPPKTEDIYKISQQLRENIDCATFEQKQNALRLLNIRCVVDRKDGTVTIRGWLPVSSVAVNRATGSRQLLFSVNRRISA